MIAVYDKLIYFNEASKYTILRMRTDDPSVPEEARSQYTFRDRMLRFTAVGYGLPQTDSVKLEIEGDWKEGKYGLQLHVEHWHELVPPTTEGLLSYLSSGLLKGIGESTARSIVQRFGTDTLDVLEFHPEKLLEIRGITEQKLEEIKTCYAESRAMRDIMELLTPFQVTPVTAMKIYQHFGPACTDILRQSPFRLCEISGFGFRRVDTIIRKSGGDPHDPVRIHGAMICALENARQHGHLYLEVNALITESMQFLNEAIPLPQMQVRRAEVEQKLQQMAEDNEIVSDGGRLYLPHIFMQEVETAAKAAAMLMEHTAKIDVALPLEQVKQKLGLHLTRRQSRGVEVAMERNLSIITGGPGTGKTTVLKAIIEVYRILRPKNRIVLAAPTGKASRRMAQSTGMLEALTLHSLLGLQGDFCSKDKQDKPLQVDFLIVDEASMVDMWLAHQLFTRLQKDTKLLLLGDVDQLESVGAGNVFAELIGSGIVPVTVLDEIFRQSKDSLIAYNAKFINEENSSLFYGPDFQFVKAENQEEAAAQIQTLYLRELQDSVEVFLGFAETADIVKNDFRFLVLLRAFCDTNLDCVNDRESGISVINDLDGIVYAGYDNSGHIRPSVAVHGFCTAAPDKQSALDGHVIERDFSVCCAAADDEVAVYGHVLERHFVGANENAAFNVLVISALGHDVSADDVVKNLRELGSGDIVQRSKDFAAAVNVVCTDHRAHIGQRPVGNLAAVGERGQICFGVRIVVQFQRTGNNRHGFLPRDRRIRSHGRSRPTVVSTHLHGHCNVFVIPLGFCNVLVLADVCRLIAPE